MPVRSTWISTSLIPIAGTSTSSSHNPGSRLLFTSAFTSTTIASLRQRDATETRAQIFFSFAATTGYQIRVFADAARRLGMRSDAGHRPLPRPGRSLGRPRHRREVRPHAGIAGCACAACTFDGVAAVGDRPAVLAAAAAEMLGIPFHPPAAARACHDKYLARQLYQAAGLRVPQFFRAALDEDPHALAAPRPIPACSNRWAFRPAAA